MTDNVITLNVPQRRQRLSERAGALVEIFAQHRRQSEDVFWLKENAELLNILECTGTPVDPAALAPHSEFYADLPERLSFFPQYYRFLISICLDLEDLGFEGAQGARLCEWIAREGLVEAEFSDLQRAEARRLLARRGVACAADPGLDDRLRAFIERSETFALPNKKAAYELTHVVFYLSEYGRKDPGLSEAAVTSLEYAGVLALLDYNMDLLAEVCVALSFAGATPSRIWTDHVTGVLREFDADTTRFAPLADDYHEYLVATWQAALAGSDAVSSAVTPTRTTFHRPAGFGGPLRAMSAAMMDMGGERSPRWSVMRDQLLPQVDAHGLYLLDDAEASTDKFDAFFAGFSRARFAG